MFGLCFFPLCSEILLVLLLLVWVVFAALDNQASDQNLASIMIIIAPLNAKIKHNPPQVYNILSSQVS